MSKFSENLKNLRLMRGMSQKQLADFLEVSTNTVSNWENGTVSPGVNMLEPMCHALEVTPDMIMGWDRCIELEEFMKRKKEILDKMEDLQKQKSDIEDRIKAYAEALTRVK